MILLILENQSGEIIDLVEARKCINEPTFQSWDSKLLHFTSDNLAVLSKHYVLY